MINIMLYLLIFLSVSLVIRAFFQFAFQRTFIINERIASYIGKPLTQYQENKRLNIKTDFLTQNLSKFTDLMKERVAKKLSKESKHDLEKKLREAGFSYKWTPVNFRVLQLLAGIILFSLCLLLFGRATDKLTALFFMSGALGALGYFYPNFYLSAKKKKRNAQVEKNLADFFDMINLSVEAGMGLDAAIVRACKNSTGPLSEEFSRAMDEMRLGKSRRDAFISLRSRVAVDAFQSLMTSIIQADQLGIGMTKVLRALTERIREHQRQLAREKAMKAPVKMLLPMAFFIFPAIFIVVLGPVILHFIVNGIGGFTK